MWNTTHKAVLDLLIPEIDAASPTAWTPPWTKLKPGEAPHNVVTGHRYRGVNILLTMLAQLRAEYPTARWLTFKQLKAAGAHLKKIEGAEKGTGQHQTVIVKVLDWLPRRERNVDDDEVRPIKILKAYGVFNVGQTEGGPREWYDAPERKAFSEGSRREINEMLRARGVQIVYDGTQPRYHLKADLIFMPEVADFKTAEDFEATRLHEAVHWSGAKHRLARPHLAAIKRDEYAREELVAEIGAAFLGAEFGLSGRLQHAEYLANWLQILKDKPQEIIQAASFASKAADYLTGREASKEEPSVEKLEEDVAPADRRAAVGH